MRKISWYIEFKNSILFREQFSKSDICWMLASSVSILLTIFFFTIIHMWFWFLASQLPQRTRRSCILHVFYLDPSKLSRVGSWNSSVEVMSRDLTCLLSDTLRAWEGLWIVRTSTIYMLDKLKTKVKMSWVCRSPSFVRKTY